MSHTFLHLTASDDWSRYYAKFEHLDVYYAQEYANLFAFLEEGVAEAVFYEQGSTRIFYPFIKRPITLTDGAYFDLVTPYGYGGPHVEGDASGLPDFYERFGALCRSQGIATETLRLHPLDDNAAVLHPVIDVQYIRHTTAVDLTQSYEQIRAGYTTNNIRNQKKAQSLGVEIREGDASADLDVFLDMYYETMDRNGAIPMYYFPKSYFEAQMKPTPLYQPHLLFAMYQGEPVAGVLMLIGKRYAHYHLGASRTEHLGLRQNNLLFDAMIRFAKEKGAQALHLGGGYREGDGLIKFKASFTGDRYFDYHIGKNVYDAEQYAALNRIAAANFDLIPNYFPQYRAIRN